MTLAGKGTSSPMVWVVKRGVQTLFPRLHPKVSRATLFAVADCTGSQVSANRFPHSRSMIRPRPGWREAALCCPRKGAEARK